MKRLILLILGVSFFVSPAFAREKREKPDSTGIDPTEIIGRYSVNYAFVEKDNGTKRHNLGLGFEKDISSSIKVGVTVPLTYAETIDGNEEEGLGEVKLIGGWRFYHREKLSALLSVFGVMDTSSDALLGDGNYKLQTGLVTSWRRSKWLFSLTGGWTLSEDSDFNEVSVSPLLGYQPMAKYLSYITVGPSYSYGLETHEDALGITVFLGKVMPNKDVLALGTQYNLEGEDDNKAFLLLSWKRLF
jgi:hypothetical protein